ncbi:MAG: T9SS type A sorting domain-containing protein [Cytophagaceae bacterium]|jgi:hypothetical protein|nr:T9SS type A sorting domain-containing protein [Cytophagaceae bacterium]
MNNFKTKSLFGAILMFCLQILTNAKVLVTLTPNTSGVPFTNPINITAGSSARIVNYLDLSITGLGPGEYVTLLKNENGVNYPLNNNTQDRDVLGDTSRLMIRDGNSIDGYSYSSSKNFTNSTTAIAIDFTVYPNLVGSFTERIAVIYSGSGRTIAFIDFSINVTTTTSTIPSLVSKGITVYPNPSIDGNLNVSDKNNTVLSYTLQSLSGDILDSNPVSATMSKIENLKTGIYLLRLNLKDGTIFHEKIIIQ